LSSTATKKIGRPADDAKRQAIVEAATHSFFEHGFAATAIEQVAADAGVSKVTVYNHFGDKRGLFVASVQAQCENMRGHFSIEESSGGDLKERLCTIGQGMMAFLSRPEMVQFERRIAAETEAEPSLGQAFLDAGPWRMKAIFGVWLQQMVDVGELRIEDPELAAEQFVSMCKGMGDLERRFGAKLDDRRNADRIRGAVDVFLGAYRAK